MGKKENIYGYEYRSELKIMDMPLIHIAIGWKDGHFLVARGIIAIGQFSFGIIAIGQFAIGAFTISQFSLGLFSVAQFAVGLKVVSQIGVSLIRYLYLI